MKSSIHPIAKITSISGLTGHVKLRPLSRYFDEYIQQKQLMLGRTLEKSETILLELIFGEGKKRQFKFKGIDSVIEAKGIIGQTLYAQANADDKINMISKNLLGYSVMTDNGDCVGVLKDVMWLPSNDVYLIQSGSKEYLIPIIPEVIKDFNHKKGHIIIVPMEGLLD